MASASESSVHNRQLWDEWASNENLKLLDSDEERVVQPNESDAMRQLGKDMQFYGRCPAWDDFVLSVCSICDSVMKLKCLKSHIGVYHQGYFPVSTQGLPSESPLPLDGPGPSLESIVHTNSSSLLLPSQNSQSFSGMTDWTVNWHSTASTSAVAHTSRYITGGVVQNDDLTSRAKSTPSTSTYGSSGNSSNSYWQDTTKGGKRRKQQKNNVKKVLRAECFRGGSQCTDNNCSPGSGSSCAAFSNEAHQRLTEQMMFEQSYPMQGSVNAQHMVISNGPLIHNITSAAIVSTVPVTNIVTLTTAASSISAIQAATTVSNASATFQSFSATTTAVSVIAVNSSDGSRQQSTQRNVDTPLLKYATALLPASSSTTISSQCSVVPLENEASTTVYCGMECVKSDKEDSDSDGKEVHQSDDDDAMYIKHHPRPLSVNTFGLRCSSYGTVICDQYMMSEPIEKSFHEFPASKSYLTASEILKRLYRDPPIAANTAKPNSSEDTKDSSESFAEAVLDPKRMRRAEQKASMVRSGRIKSVLSELKKHCATMSALSKGLAHIQEPGNIYTSPSDAWKVFTEFSKATEAVSAASSSERAKVCVSTTVSETEQASSTAVPASANTVKTVKVWDQNNKSQKSKANKRIQATLSNGSAIIRCQLETPLSSNSVKKMHSMKLPMNLSSGSTETQIPTQQLLNRDVSKIPEKSVQISSTSLAAQAWRKDSTKPDQSVWNGQSALPNRKSVSPNQNLVFSSQGKHRKSNKTIIKSDSQNIANLDTIGNKVPVSNNFDIYARNALQSIEHSSTSAQTPPPAHNGLSSSHLDRIMNSNQQPLPAVNNVKAHSSWDTKLCAAGGVGSSSGIYPQAILKTSSRKKKQVLW